MKFRDTELKRRHLISIIIGEGVFSKKFPNSLHCLNSLSCYRPYIIYESFIIDNKLNILWVLIQSRSEDDYVISVFLYTSISKLESIIRKVPIQEMGYDVLLFRVDTFNLYKR